MYFVVLALIGTFMLLVTSATIYEIRLVRRMKNLPSIIQMDSGERVSSSPSPMSDEDDTCSVCTQCSKCSSGRYPAVERYTSSNAATLTPLANNSESLQMAANENNNFLSHYQNGWCACANDTLQGVHVNNNEEEELSKPKFADPLSLNLNPPKYNCIDQHSDFRLGQLLSRDLNTTLVSVVTQSRILYGMGKESVVPPV